MSHAQQLHNRRYLDGYMQIINRTGFPDNVKAEVCQQGHHAVLTTVQWTIERALEEELTAYLGCQRYEHLPQGRPAEQTRGGCYRRALLTQYAGIPDLRVSKLRRGNCLCAAGRPSHATNGAGGHCGTNRFGAIAWG